MVPPLSKSHRVPWMCLTTKPLLQNLTSWRRIKLGFVWPIVDQWARINLEQWRQSTEGLVNSMEVALNSWIYGPSVTTAWSSLAWVLQSQLSDFTLSLTHTTERMHVVFRFRRKCYPFVMNCWTMHVSWAVIGSCWMMYRGKNGVHHSASEEQQECGWNLLPSEDTHNTEKETTTQNPWQLYDTIISNTDTHTQLRSHLLTSLHWNDYWLWYCFTSV